MKIRIIIGICSFVAFSLLCVFAAWCSGFNFDARNPDVGFGVVTSAVFACMVAVFASTFPQEGGPA